MERSEIHLGPYSYPVRFERPEPECDIVPGGPSIYLVMFIDGPTKIITREQRVVADGPDKAVLLVATEAAMTIEAAADTIVKVKFVCHL